MKRVVRFFLVLGYVLGVTSEERLERAYRDQ